MSWWVEDQLKSALLTDLRPIIPEGYFELESNKLQLDASLDKTGHLSKELSWGTAAGRLGHSTYFKNTAIIAPRQLSAADVLMNLGMLVAARASYQACSNVKAHADSLKVFDGNAEKVALQLKEEQIPQLELNVRGALTQYLRHLSKEEAAPYLSMLKTEDLIELGLRVRMRDKVLSWVAKNLGAIVVSVVTALAIALFLSWLGIPH
ncbi:MAG: hypothetical protein Q8P42_00985 [Gallionella sp.]|nr:hypothetical protein [Gallionella sp.]